MNTFRKHSSHLLILLVLACLVAGCDEEIVLSDVPYAWIDVPIDGLHVPVDEHVNIEGHAAYTEPIARVEIWVDGELHIVQESPPTKGTLARFEQPWMPPGDGEYVVQVVAIGTDGSASAPDSVTVRVGDAVAKAAPTDTPTPVPTDGPTQVVTVPPTDAPTPVPTDIVPTGVPTDVPTRVPTNVPTDVPTAVPQIDFWADDEGGGAGFCTRVHWRTQNVTAVFFNGNGVVGEGSHKTCPCEDETHTLTVNLPDGSQTSRTLTIRVKGSCVTPTPTEKPTKVPDTTPPPVPTPWVPADGLVLDCKDSQNLQWLPVEDNSGKPVVYYVKLEQQIKAGQWKAVRGWGPVSGKQVTAGKTKESGSDPLICGSLYRWRVRAQDQAGNYSNWSAWSQFSLKLN